MILAHTVYPPVQLQIFPHFQFDALLQPIDDHPIVHHKNAVGQMIRPCEHQSCAQARRHSEYCQNQCQNKIIQVTIPLCSGDQEVSEVPASHNHICMHLPSSEHFEYPLQFEVCKILTDQTACLLE